MAGQAGRVPGDLRGHAIFAAIRWLMRRLWHIGRPPRLRRPDMAAALCRESLFLDADGEPGIAASLSQAGAHVLATR